MNLFHEHLLKISTIIERSVLHWYHKYCHIPCIPMLKTPIQEACVYMYLYPCPPKKNGCLVAEDLKLMIVRMCSHSDDDYLTTIHRPIDIKLVCTYTLPTTYMRTHNCFSTHISSVIHNQPCKTFTKMKLTFGHLVDGVPCFLYHRLRTSF